jgi:hypothetical protein
MCCSLVVRSCGGCSCQAHKGQEELQRQQALFADVDDFVLEEC